MAKATKKKSVIEYDDSHNVFESLGFSKHEAAELEAKARLHIELCRYIDREGFTRKDLEEILGETQPRVSDLMRGKIDRFSIGKLLHYLGKLGAHVEFKVVRKRGRSKAS